MLGVLALGCGSGGGRGTPIDSGVTARDGAAEAHPDGRTLPGDAGGDVSRGRDAARDARVGDAARADGSSADGRAPPGTDGAVPTTCSDGAPVAYARTSCPGAPGVVSGTLVSQAGFDTRGETLPLDGLGETSLPCYPTIVCVANGAPTLLFSDDPESPSADGVLYADVLAPGPYRAYVYHVNAGAGLRKFPVVLLNQGSATVNVTITAEGIAGPSQDYVAVGKQAIQGWLGSQGMSTVVPVPAGQRVLLDASLDAVHAAMNELAHAIIDFSVDGAVKASVVSVLDTEDATVVTAGLSLLANDGLHTRGSFAHAALEIEARAPLDGQGARRLRFGDNVTDETLTGHDYVDGTSVTLDGNYGVSYTLGLTVTVNTTLLLSPQGGAWGGVASIPSGIDGASGVTLLPSATDSLASQTDAIVLGVFAAGAVSGLTLMSAGGSNLPVDLVTVPLAP